MSRSCFIDLATAFCTLANIGQPALLLEGGAIEVDGVDFFLQYDERILPDHLVVYCDFGMPPAAQLQAAYAALLETNMIVYGANAPAFMLDLDKRVVFGYQCPLQELKAPALMDIFLTLAGQVRDWRLDHFLDGQHAPGARP